MSRLFHTTIEAFPSYEKIYLSFESVEPTENDDYYEMEIDRDVMQLSKLLRKLRPLKDLQNPLKGFVNFAQETLNRGIHSCYCHQDSLNSIIDAYHQRDKAPDKEFTTANDTDECVPDFITESFILPERVMLDGMIRKKGSRLTFYHGESNGK